jgi:YD repeat-containing protein
VAIPESYAEQTDRLQNNLSELTVSPADVSTTTYVYDLNNNPTKITDASGNVRNFTYDGMNRRLTAEDLHASSDTTYGTTTYAYDDAGNLTQKVDPKSQTVNTTYDVLNRPLTEDYTGAAGTEITYAYDTCLNGKGRFCAATSTYNGITISTTDAYNPLGLKSNETKYINGQYYISSTTYDRLANQTDILYPDNSEVFYTLDGTNQVTNVQQREGASSAWRTLASSITYSPLNQEQTVVWGSGATTTNTYDPNNLYRLTHKVTLLPDSGDWGTGASSNPIGLITSPSTENAQWSSASTPPNVSTNLNSDSYWFSHSLTYQDSFENGTSTWTVYMGSALASSTVDCTTAFTGNCSLRVNVSSTSDATVPEIIQLLRTDPNVNYTLKFRAKASATTTVEASLQQNDGAYSFYGLDKTPTVTPKWKEYSYYFSSTATSSDKDSRVILTLGAAHSDTYWIDDVELIPDALNLTTDPSFENTGATADYTWGLGSQGGASEATASTDCTTPTTDGTCSYNVNVLQASTTDWYVQLYHDYNIATGTSYILAFDAKSSVARDADTFLQENHNPYTIFTPTVHFTLYPTWNHYVIDFGPTTGGDANSDMFINLGTAASNTWFDNFHLFIKQNTKVTAPPPVFTGIYDSTGTSTASAYQIQVIKEGGNWSSPLWDSGKTTLSPQTQIGSRTATSTYAGPTLPSNGTDAQKYYWRIKVWDQSNNASPWTNGNDFFMTPGNRVQDLTYAYDADGNITHLVDGSYTKTAKTVDYTYDDLNRLTKASTTPALDSGAPNAGRNVTEAWTYDALGNILTDATTTGGVTATTTYTYAGNTGSNCADPDAATQIGNDSLTYDKNGNTTSGFGLTNVFDWRDRLATTTGPATIITSYDENNQRMRMNIGANTTHFPTPYFTKVFPSFAATAHVLLNGRTIATITGTSTASTTLYYVYSSTAITWAAMMSRPIAITACKRSRITRRSVRSTITTSWRVTRKSANSQTRNMIKPQTSTI